MKRQMQLLLLQIRNPGDPMRAQEIDCFADAAGVDRDQIIPWDLLAGAPDSSLLEQSDAVLIGGSGDYSVTREEEWLEASFELLRWLVSESKPTFASCWGFQ
ncbi:MAG: type 1 glutamine amidotransferase, partial [Pirellulales bacterium]|nr:type 1 glutamine amidotransferase [Pirellulales bacterium]